MEYYGVQGLPMSNGTINRLTTATDWISHNSNYTQWIFNIKPGLKWSNGQSVTSNDLLTSFSPAFYFNTTYDVLSMGPEVKNEYALNGSAAVFNLKVSDARWADKMGVPSVGFGIFPADIASKYGPAYPNLGTNIVTGPFYVSNYTAGQFTMKMLRNPYYTPLPTVCEIDINFVESLSQTAQTLLAGVSDWAQIEPSNAQAILANPNLHILAEPSMETTTLEYNNTVYPFNMTAFRQALVYGINQSELVQTAFNGYGHTAYDSMGVSPSYWHNYWYSPNIKKYSYSPSQALSLLNSIGMTKKSDNLLHYPNGTAVSLRVWAPTDTTVDTIGARVLKEDLAKIGITVNIQSASTSDIIGDLASNVNNIARTGVILFTYQADDFGFMLDEVLPAPAVYWIAPVSGHTWEWPAYVQDWYKGNISVIDSTNDQPTLQKAVWNIEAMNAQYLPSIILAYPDELFTYSTARFTGWIQSPEMFVYGSTTLNPYSLVSLTPAASTSSTPSSGVSSYLIAAGAAVVIVAIAGITLYMRRARKT
jgi:ABC-type transport system substrate-binding protein